MENWWAYNSSTENKHDVRLLANPFRGQSGRALPGSRWCPYTTPTGSDQTHKSPVSRWLLGCVLYWWAVECHFCGNMSWCLDLEDAGTSSSLIFQRGSCTNTKSNLKCESPYVDVCVGPTAAINSRKSLGSTVNSRPACAHLPGSRQGQPSSTQRGGRPWAGGLDGQGSCTSPAAAARGRVGSECPGHRGVKSSLTIANAVAGMRS